MGTQPEEPAVPVRAPSHGTSQFLPQLKKQKQKTMSLKTKVNVMLLFYFYIVLLWPVWTLDLEWWSACANVATMELNVEGLCSFHKLYTVYINIQQDLP